MSSSLMRGSIAALVVAPLVLGLADRTAGAQAPDGRWVRLAPYPQPTQEIGGAVVNGKLSILGAYGANVPNGLAGWFNEYDPATPAGDNWFPTNRSWEYTPGTDTWREIAAMPTKRGGGTELAEPALRSPRRGAP